MTILKPHQNFNLRKFLLVLFALILSGGLVYIFEYNSFVNARYELASFKKELVSLQASNADLKNQLFETLAPVNLRQVAQVKNLVLDQRPSYLRQNQWLSDSSR
ncbi:MAG: hypothetical protein AAB432_02835 [Patescibacteria group bacterium]